MQGPKLALWIPPSSGKFFKLLNFRWVDVVKRVELFPLMAAHFMFCSLVFSDLSVFR
jgi:hypothetical protein